jgi:16S rRNA (cytosine967-C5)-methyltransferase
MTPGARLAAAAEVIEEIFARKAAADRTLAAWGRAHRFAGSKDRAAIADRVYTVLRRRNECAHLMRAEAPRTLVIGSLALEGTGIDDIVRQCTDGRHAIGALTPHERQALARPPAPPGDQPWVMLNYPAWLHEDLSAAFPDNLRDEMTALNERAPLDLRVNVLKATREVVQCELAEAGLVATQRPHVAHGLRLALGSDAKLTSLAAYREGRVEIQDEASQRAVLLADARPGDTVIDLAAGAGGKSLALAAAMQNRGRILVCDVEPSRLRQMEPRVARAGAKIIEIVGDPYGGAIAAAAAGGADIVFVDAPCSGSGTWRRNPESKWTLDARRLEGYRTAQAKLLDRAVALTKPHGRIVYAVCSLLPSEGPGQVAAFLGRTSGWTMPKSARWTPACDGTDGFFVAILMRGTN